jgi:two-component system sensor histidine kinase AlgZ
MGNVASINQTGTGIRLPNFCNLGVMLRSLVVVNLLLAAGAVLRVAELRAAAYEFMVMATFAEPILIVSLVALCGARRWLHAIGYAGSVAVLFAFELVLAWGMARAVGDLFADRGVGFGRLAVLVLIVTGITLAYFDLRARALAPAIADARIQALQARIRPHFLYNSINAVLSLMRSEPRRAERALEDLADLFRVLMSENRTLAPIAEEVELARQYLAIETLRLGEERLRVAWSIDAMPGDALVPPLMLQPLVENAVYHGIEPSPEGGEVTIDVRRDGRELVMTLANPLPAESRQTVGNRMAIANIRERLQLHFDAEASMRSEVSDGRYRVVIRMPYLTVAA